ncbi:dynein regulatory complex subunit 2 isoform X2 [Eublepharis macularius]|uniref:Dynein regulatory complex subunit 2 n=1 Tax=Eublepharis macularius TaxID=481883 RepID=A0AA97KTT0_EUBMA|nr:dynein regulatory complex subunit 2 isoform X2 [Eublepharis macularius]
MPKKTRKRVVLTEEERVLMMQQKLLAEEELNKKKEDMLAQFLKDKLAKEERNSVLNMNKITLQWRTVLREVKARELRKDIEILSQTFERVVDCKDSVIKSLAKDLDEAEAQYTHALRSHLHNIDELLQLQCCRLGYLEEDYNAELEALQKEFDTERRKIIEYHEQEIRYLQDVLLAMEQNFGESEYEAKLDFQSTRDDIKNKNLEEKHYLRMQLEGKVEELWKRFQQALRNYTEATEDRKIAFEALKLKDEKSTKEIEMQMKKLQKMQDLILSLKNKIAAHVRESEEQNRRIRDEKEVVLKQLQMLKSEMNQARAKARSNLAKLTVESCATLKVLQRVVQKMMDDYVGLERFWQRYNKVRLEQLSLQRTKAALAEDNRKLRHLLKQYLDGISVNDEVLSQINPLMIVNQHNVAPPLPHTVPVTEARVKRPVYNIVEAAHEVKHIL